MPLGILNDYVYEEYRFGGVKSGQVYLASTDGVWETFDPEGEMFGKDRIQEFLRKNAHRPVAEISELLRAELTGFRGEHTQDDDVTFVVVKVL